MTFLNKLKAHLGGLVRIKTELYWYEIARYGPDGVPGRIYLLVDAQEQISPDLLSATTIATIALPLVAPVSILILVDGIPKWVWTWDEVLDLIDTNPDGSQKIF